MPREISQAIVNAACNKIGGPYHLEKLLGHNHGHLSKCRSGEEGVSKHIARKLVKIIGATKSEWEKVLA